MTTFVGEDEAAHSAMRSQYRGPMKAPIHVTDTNSKSITMPCGAKSNDPHRLLMMTNLTAQAGPRGERAAIEIAETVITATTKVSFAWKKCS